MGKKRSELIFSQRSISQSELYRNIVKPTRRETAIEMPQARNNHSDDRDLDVRPRLIEDEEIEACAAGDVEAGEYLLAGVVKWDRLRVRTWLHYRLAIWNQKGMLLQA
jgi:hypothetical protein